ncbi:MAG: hypothetical protein LUH54_01190 [Firmicutes bacterium]|nr:hypothetical protein [Bacillota bacterium]
MNEGGSKNMLCKIPKGKLIISALLLILGAALIIFGGSLFENDSEVGQDVTEVFLYSDYAAALRDEIAAMCESVDGVDDVFVMLTLDEETNVRGVAVVCFGGEDISVKKTLTELISRALGIPISKISVAGAG